MLKNWTDARNNDGETGKVLSSDNWIAIMNPRPLGFSSESSVVGPRSSVLGFLNL